MSLHDTVSAAVAAVESNECAEVVGSPAVVEILSAFDIILVTFPTVSVDDIESGLTDFEHVRLDDFIDSEGEDAFAVLRIAAILVDDDGVFGGGCADEPDGLRRLVSGLVDGGDGNRAEAALPAVFGQQ